MPTKFICKLSGYELKRLYIEEGKTQSELCEIVGCKSLSTMKKILNAHGIDTNRNAATALKNRNGMPDEQFRDYLIKEYETKSIREISIGLGINPVVIRRYFKKYGIEFKSTREAQGSKGKKNARWNGGRHIHNGYIEVYAPDHPNKNKRNCVYEHQLVMEKHIGRYLEKGEVVHHKDLCKTNNSIENLQLMTNSEHTRLHGLMGTTRRNRKNGDIKGGTL